MDDGPFAELTVADDVATALVRPEHAARLCEGHFPDDPLVPGAYLAGLMAELGGRLHAARPPARLVRCDFIRPVRPSQAIRVSARRVGPGRVAAEIHAAGRPAARALLAYGA
jgi:hypothetical protein